MALIERVTILRYHSAKLRCCVAVMLVLLLSACASQVFDIAKPPPLLGAGPAVEIPDVDVLEVTPRMHSFLDRYVMGYESADMRRQLLAIALTDRSMLGFYYNLDRTLTAEDAFNTRSGNCIGFANLYIALAREAGLNAQYHEVIIEPEWRSEQDTLIVARHINVLVNSSHGPFQVDISGREANVSEQRRILKDHEAKALYFNNLAMDALFAQDLATAHAYLVKAIEIAPAKADTWTNMGVVLSRNEQLQDAEFAYQTALRIDPGDRSAMANMYELYMAQERIAEAETLKRKVDRYRRENPYYLLALSDEAIEQEQFEESIDLLRRAIAKKDDEHRLHFALARTQYLSGHMDEAENSLNRARELAPEDVQEDYSQPLHELMHQKSDSTLQ